MSMGVGDTVVVIQKCTLIIFNAVITMKKLQDLFPYNKTILGLNNQYIVMDNNSFLINSPAIISDGHIVSFGCTYLLLWSEIERVYVHHVQLADVYHDNEKVNLLLYEKSSNHTEKLELYLDMEHQSTWVLIDMDYIQNHYCVFDYCGKEINKNNMEFS